MTNQYPLISNVQKGFTIDAFIQNTDSVLCNTHTEPIMQLNALFCCSCRFKWSINSLGVKRQTEEVISSKMTPDWGFQSPVEASGVFWFSAAPLGHRLPRTNRSHCQCLDSIGCWMLGKRQNSSIQWNINTDFIVSLSTSYSQSQLSEKKQKPWITVILLHRSMFYYLRNCWNFPQKSYNGPGINEMLSGFLRLSVTKCGSHQKWIIRKIIHDFSYKRYMSALKMKYVMQTCWGLADRQSMYYVMSCFRTKAVYTVYWSISSIDILLSVWILCLSSF